MKLTVDLGASSYPIYIENGLLKNAASYIETAFTGKRIMIISDDNVYPLYGEKLLDALSAVWDCHSLVLPHGESTKDFQSLPRIYDALLAAGISRSDLVIALGGGVIGDLAGFAASSFLRGVRPVADPHFSPGSGGFFCRRKGRCGPAPGKEPGGRILPALSGAH